MNQFQCQQATVWSLWIIFCDAANIKDIALTQCSLVLVLHLLLTLSVISV